MAVATFDTLKFANTLKAAGVPPQQAEAQAVAFAEVIQLNFKDLVTKDDLRQELAALREELKREIKEESLKLNAKIDTLYAKLVGEMTLLKWMFGLNITVMAGILVRLFFFRIP